jgi:hypothetical protein
MKKEDNKLYSWLFHYNPYQEQWNAFNREDSTAYWNNSKTIHSVYSAPEFHTLIEILYTHNLCT